MEEKALNMIKAISPCIQNGVTDCTVTDGHNSTTRKIFIIIFHHYTLSNITKSLIRNDLNRIKQTNKKVIDEGESEFLWW